MTEFDGRTHAWKTLDFIRERPDLHNQARWVDLPYSDGASASAESAMSCGTAACFAGWYALLAGRELVRSEGAILIEGTGDEVDDWVADQIGVSLSDATGSLFCVILDLTEIEEGLIYLIGPRPGGAA